MDILKLAALAVTAALCALVLRKRVPERAVVLVLAAGVLILSQAMEALAGVRGLMDSLARTAGLSPEIWKPVVKTLGIGIVARLAAAVMELHGERSMRVVPKLGAEDGAFILEDT